MTFRLEVQDARYDSRALEYWPTDPRVTRAVLAEHPPRTNLVIEPCAGRGAITVELEKAGFEVLSLELNREHHMALMRNAAGPVYIRDALSEQAEDTVKQWADGRPFTIVTNPPYSMPAMLDFAKLHTLWQMCVGARLLMPTSFIHSEERLAFNSTYRAEVIRPLVPRPSTSEDGSNGKRDLSWFVYETPTRGARPTAIWPMTWKGL